MPRPRKSVEQHVRDGTYRSDRHGPRPDAAELPAGVPDKPADLPPEAGKVWDRIAPLLAGVVRPSDAPMLAEACVWWAELGKVRATLKKTPAGEKGYNQLLIGAGICSDKLDKLLSRFGLTPADRAKLRADSGPPVAKTPTRPRTKLDAQGPPK